MIQFDMVYLEIFTLFRYLLLDPVQCSSHILHSEWKQGRNNDTFSEKILRLLPAKKLALIISNGSNINFYSMDY